MKNTEATAAKNEVNTRSGAMKVLSAIGSFLKSIFNVILSILKSLVAFFWALALGAKVTFLIILALAIAISYMVGYRQGEDAKVREIETELGTLKTNTQQINEILKNIQD